MPDMIRYLRKVFENEESVPARELFERQRSRRAMICLFLALLELVRLQAILLRQDRNFSEIFVKKQDQLETVLNERISEIRDDWA